MMLELEWLTSDKHGIIDNIDTRIGTSWQTKMKDEESNVGSGMQDEVKHLKKEEVRYVRIEKKKM